MADKLTLDQVNTVVESKDSTLEEAAERLIALKAIKSAYELGTRDEKPKPKSAADKLNALIEDGDITSKNISDKIDIDLVDQSITNLENPPADDDEDETFGSRERTPVTKTPTKARSVSPSKSRSVSPSKSRSVSPSKSKSADEEGTATEEGEVPVKKSKKSKKKAKEEAPAKKSKKEKKASSTKNELTKAHLNPEEIFDFVQVGAGFVKDKSATKEENSAARKAYVRADLMKYKDACFPEINGKKVNKCKVAIKYNLKIIKKSLTVLPDLRVAFAVLGKDATLQTTIGSRAVSLAYDSYLALEAFYNQRIKVVGYLYKAERMQEQKTYTDTDFARGMRRVLLTSEAIKWIKADPFTISGERSVKINKKKYTNLRSYLEATLGIKFEDTQLAKGRATANNVAALVRLALGAKLPQKKVADVKSEVYYAPSESMKEYLGGDDTPATYSFEKTAKGAKKVKNTDDNASVFDVLTERYKDSNVLFNPKKINMRYVMSLATAIVHKIDDGRAADAVFFKDYTPKVHDAFIKESKAIGEFSKAVSTLNEEEKAKTDAAERIKTKAANKLKRQAKAAEVKQRKTKKTKTGRK